MRNITDIVSNTKQVPSTRYRATNLLKQLGVVNHQLLKHWYKNAVQEYVEIPIYLARQLPSRLPINNVTYIWTGKPRPAFQ